MKNFTGHPAPKNPRSNSNGNNGGPAPIGAIQPGKDPYAGITVIPSGTAITFGSRNGRHTVTYRPPKP